MRNGLPPRHVAILGLMGAGKTSVGRELAGRTSWRLSDSDVEIEQATGRTAREIKEADGEDRLHELEVQQLMSALSSHARSVICPAAYVVVVERCREALASERVLTVWLTAPPERLAERFMRDSHRPFYGASPIAFLTAQHAARAPLFHEVADLTIDVTSCTPSEVVDKIVAIDGLVALSSVHGDT